MRIGEVDEDEVDDPLEGEGRWEDEIEDPDLVQSFKGASVELLHCGDPLTRCLLRLENHLGVHVERSSLVVKVDPGGVVLVTDPQPQFIGREDDLGFHMVRLTVLLPQGVRDPLKVSLGLYQELRRFVVNSKIHFEAIGTWLQRLTVMARLGQSLEKVTLLAISKGDPVNLVIRPPHLPGSRGDLDNC